MPRFSIKRTLLLLGRMLLAIYLGLIVVLFIFQRQLIYHPERQPESRFLLEAKAAGAQSWRNAAGEIIGWTRDSKRAANRMLVFHGNAGYALMRTPFIDGFQQLDNGTLWQVYLFEYPGYGARPGEISETSFREAAAAALKLLQQDDPRPIYLLGESLGSGLACSVAHDQPNAVTGLVLVTPFSSLRGAAHAHFPFVPVGLLLRDHWDNIAALASFREPIAITLAGKDTVVTTGEGQRLFQAVRAPKRLWIDPEADHNDLDYSPNSRWWREVSDFLLENKPHTDR